MNEELKLFQDDGKNPIGPQSKNNKNSELITHGVEDALKGEKVKTLLIPETIEILLPNYVLDFRKAVKLRQHQIQSLATILVDDGDTAIYVCLQGQNGSIMMERIGMGDSEVLGGILLPGVKSIFGKSCKLYRDVERGRPLKEMRQYDPEKIRLRI